jgi:hypothetical protein
MPNERLSTPGEHNETISADLEAARSEKLTELAEAFKDADPADHAEKRAEKAREVIKRQEIKPEPVAAPETATPISRPLAFLDHHLNYRQTLASVQRKLSPASRSFSKVIHTPVVEKTSEVLETTIARPSVMLGTTWTALIVGTSFYLIARHYGYALSGSELLFSFIVGALLGIVGEGLWTAFKRR